MEGSEIGVVGTVNRNYTSEIAEKVIHAVFNFIFGKGTFFPCYEWQGDRHRCLVLRAAERIFGAQGKCLFGGPQILNSKKKYSASSRFTRKAGVVRSLIRTTTAECSQYGPTKHRQCNNQSIFTYFTFVGFPKAGPGTPPPPPPRRACSCYWRPVASVMYTNIWKGSWFKLHRIRWYSVLQFL